MRLKYDDWQEDFVKCEGDKILCCGRQIGKTEVCARDASEFAVKNPKTKPIVMIAPTERQARALFNKTLNYLAENYPKHLIIKGKDRPTKERIKLKTGVEFYCLPVGKDGLSIRFITIGRLYKDECSRIPEMVHDAVDPALLTTGGDEIDLSTPAGSTGRFFEIFTNKDSAWDSFTRFSKSSEEVMNERPICATWTEKQREKALLRLERAKKRMSKNAYAQEYLGMFMENLYRFFSDLLIEETCVLKRRPIIIHNKEYYMGCDLAWLGEDEGVISIIDKLNDDYAEQVENIITKHKRTDETERKIKDEDAKFNTKKVLIDSGGGIGISVFDHLLADEQTRRKVIAIDNSQRVLDRDGKKKTRILKEDLYDNLKALMEQAKIKLLDDDSLKDSLASIRFELIMENDRPTRVEISGDYAHQVEALIRAAWGLKYKSLNVWVSSIKI